MSLHEQMSSMQVLLDKQQLTEQQLRDRNSSLEEMLADTHRQLVQQVGQLNETTSEELALLSIEVNTLKQEKVCNKN